MDSFEEFLSEHHDTYLNVITPGGNHGDTLIHMGLMKKLEEYGIEYTCFNLEEIYNQNLWLGVKYLVNIGLWKIGSNQGFKLFDLPSETELILFEGGGYMSDIWYGPTLLKQIIKQCNAPVAICPQSYLFTRTRFEEYFKDKRPVYLFCREKYSFELLSEMNLPNNVYVSVSPELAFYLTRDDLTEFVESRTGDYDLVSFRDDRESAINQDMKKKVIRESNNPLVADISMKRTLKDFVSTVYNANHIYTDRLHVAILSKILGKQATLYGNKYHKNKGVWEYSLYDSIEFVEV